MVDFLYILLSSLLTSITLLGGTSSVNGYMLQQLPQMDTQIVQDQCRNFTLGISEHLRSPGYPNNYPTDVDCRKIIKAGPHFNIKLKFLFFHLEASEGCKYDYIEIRDGMYGFSPLLLRACFPASPIIMQRIGRINNQFWIRWSHCSLPGTVFKSSGQYLWIRFVSDSQITQRGFLATVSALPKNEGPDTDNTLMDCYKVIEGQTNFRISDQTIPDDVLSYYQSNPEKRLNCVWDIRMPDMTKVFFRITNYTSPQLTITCENSGLEVYDVSTAEEDARGRWCMKPMTPWISGAQRALLHLYANSLADLPQFEIIGNIYIKDMENGNCSDKKNYISCHDGYCIPADLRCNHQENCGEGYDEDCAMADAQKKFQTKYIALFIVVIVGSILLTSLMTLSEVVLRRKEENKQQKERDLKELMASSSQESTQSSRKSMRRSIKGTSGSERPQCDMDSRKIESDIADDSFSAGTFRSSRLNENVSFRKVTPFTGFNSGVPPKIGDSPGKAERIYALPNTRISLPHGMASLADLPPAPPAPPTPPPPPAPMGEGRGFRLIYDLTNLGKTTTVASKPSPSQHYSTAGRKSEFEYPPPPSFLRQSSSQDSDDWNEDYTSTSSSSIQSLLDEGGRPHHPHHPHRHRTFSERSADKRHKHIREPIYDVACIDRKRKKSNSKLVPDIEITTAESPRQTPKHLRKRDSRTPPRVAPKPPTPKSPAVVTKRSWTFDDSTDDGAMELTTYISTC